MTLNEIISILEEQGVRTEKLDDSDSSMLDVPCDVYRVDQQLSPDSELKETLEKIGYGFIMGTEDYFKDLARMDLKSKQGEVSVLAEKMEVDTGTKVEDLGEPSLDYASQPRPSLNDEDYARIMQNKEGILLVHSGLKGGKEIKTYTMVYLREAAIEKPVEAIQPK